MKEPIWGERLVGSESMNAGSRFHRGLWVAGSLTGALTSPQKCCPREGNSNSEVKPLTLEVTQGRATARPPLSARI